MKNLKLFSIVALVTASFFFSANTVFETTSDVLFSNVVALAQANPETYTGPSSVYCGTITIQDNKGNSYTIPYMECSGYGTLSCSCN